MVKKSDLMNNKKVAADEIYKIIKEDKLDLKDYFYIMILGEL